mmetsp:Transcript_23973/g.58023  ORF Transcript_23973/g.58023 Transcript_23973/m.58023 type:complete len:241 (+) Transcript_23973:189-911(+)
MRASRRLEAVLAGDQAPYCPQEVVDLLVRDRDADSEHDDAGDDREDHVRPDAAICNRFPPACAAASPSPRPLLAEAAGLVEQAPPRSAPAELRQARAAVLPPAPHDRLRGVVHLERDGERGDVAPLLVRVIPARARARARLFGEDDPCGRDPRRGRLRLDVHAFTSHDGGEEPAAVPLRLRRMRPDAVGVGDLDEHEVDPRPQRGWRRGLGVLRVPGAGPGGIVPHGHSTLRRRREGGGG